MGEDLRPAEPGATPGTTEDEHQAPASTPIRWRIDLGILCGGMLLNSFIFALLALSESSGHKANYPKSAIGMGLAGVYALIAIAVRPR